jgi:hypothetical protein
MTTPTSHYSNYHGRTSEPRQLSLLHSNREAVYWQEGLDGKNISAWQFLPVYKILFPLSSSIHSHPNSIKQFSTIFFPSASSGFSSLCCFEPFLPWTRNTFIGIVYRKDALSTTQASLLYPLVPELHQRDKLYR